MSDKKEELVQAAKMKAYYALGAYALLDNTPIAKEINDLIVQYVESPHFAEEIEETVSYEDIFRGVIERRSLYLLEIGHSSEEIEEQKLIVNTVAERNLGGLGLYRILKDSISPEGYDTAKRAKQAVDIIEGKDNAE